VIAVSLQIVRALLILGPPGVVRGGAGGEVVRPCFQFD
jgi:hypothetical protein